jgi:hypothetical protein
VTEHVFHHEGQGVVVIDGVKQSRAGCASGSEACEGVRFDGDGAAIGSSFGDHGSAIVSSREIDWALSRTGQRSQEVKHSELR